ncbi:DNA cytosine methyltransferase [Rhizobium leguminosarum]|nr:DNA cytosine methyltransferase [Rhizobium leguminosarum]
MRARLQGFPDDWQFVGGIPAVADQIGNAVTPSVAQAVGLAIYSALRGMEFDMAAMLNMAGASSGNGTIVRLEAPSLVPDLDASEEHFEEMFS